MDTNLYPVRGQTILVRSPNIKEFYDVDRRSSQLRPVSRTTEQHPLDVNETGEVTYVIPRPGGTTLLGGTYQPNNWDTSVDFATAEGIFERCARLVPSLRDSETRIISHNVGLRPARHGGPRVELEWVQLPPKGNLLPELENPDKRFTGKPSKALVVHAYGFG
jgi:D-amino-acid oxidase